MEYSRTLLVLLALFVGGCAAALNEAISDAMETVVDVAVKTHEIMSDLDEAYRRNVFINSSGHLVFCSKERSDDFIVSIFFNENPEHMARLRSDGYIQVDDAAVTGVELATNPAHSFPEVIHVHPKSQAHSAGLKLEDQIISVNIDTVYCAGDARDLLFGQINTSVVVLVRRDGIDNFILLQREPYVELFGDPEGEIEIHCK